MTHPRALLALASALLLAALLPACSNDPHPAPFRQTRDDGSPWQVRYDYMPEEIRSLDPQVGYDQISRYIIEPVQDTLLQYRVMQTDPYEVEPSMLEAMPERTGNPDGSVTYLCRLKRGILFHDDPCFERTGGKGREVVAEDVHYAFQRISDPKVLCPIFEALAPYVAGMKETYDEAKKTGSFDYDRMRIRGVEVVDSHTFRIHLLKPYPQIVYWMAMQFTSPTSREGVEYYDGQVHDGVQRPLFKFHLVGHGPFIHKEWVRGQRHVLVRNPNYRTNVFPSGGWPADREAVNRPLAGKPLPIVDEVQFTVFKEILPIWLLTRQGYLDRMGVMKDAANSAITSSSELAPKYAERGMRLEKALDVSTFFMVINMQDPLLGKNKKLRQALSCAFDPKGYIDMLYGGVAPVAQQLVPPGIYGHDKSFVNPFGPNIEKGRQLLAEAGYPGGIDPQTGQPLEISMDVSASGGEERQLAEYEQRQFEQLGIRVRIIENTFARLQDKEKQGNFQMAGSGWGADYPDAENFLFLFAGSQFPPGGPNYARFDHPEYNRLFDQMQTMENTPERLAIIKQMNDILIDECPMILRFHKGYYVIGQPWAPTTHMNLLLEGGIRYRTVDPELREQKRAEWNPQPKWPIAAGLGVIALGVVWGVRVNRRRNV